MTQPAGDVHDDERPPFFKKWSSWYWLVLGVLAVQVILYYLITLRFS